MKIKLFFQRNYLTLKQIKKYIKLMNFDTISIPYRFIRLFLRFNYLFIDRSTVPPSQLTNINPQTIININRHNRPTNIQFLSLNQIPKTSLNSSMASSNTNLNLTLLILFLTSSFSLAHRSGGLFSRQGRPCDEVYVVGEGETLHTISDRCGDPYILEQNPHVQDSDDVFPGLVIKITTQRGVGKFGRKFLNRG